MQNSSLSSIRVLPQLIRPELPLPEMTGGSNPVRSIVERAASGDWSLDDANYMAADYDRQAPIWKSWVDNPDYLAPVADALDRGVDIDCGLALIAGGGTAPEAALLADRGFTTVVGDIAPKMLELSESPRRILTDLSASGIRDASIDLVVLLNAPLFAPEMARIIRPGGWLIWASSFGPNTPIYLSTVAAASAVIGAGMRPAASALAGHGEWSTYTTGLA